MVIFRNDLIHYGGKVTGIPRRILFFYLDLISSPRSDGDKVYYVMQHHPELVVLEPAKDWEWIVQHEGRSIVTLAS